MRRVLGMSLVAVVGSAAVALRCSGVWERLTSWGVDPIVSASVFPGDDLVLDPTAVDTRSLEIAAPLSAIWPWLVQMGDDRGGEYSYSVCGLPHRKGADRIVPEWQDLGQKARRRDKTRYSQPNEGRPSSGSSAVDLGPHALWAER